MSDKTKKDIEVMNLLEESDDLAIGAGTGSLVNVNIPGGMIISSAMPPVLHLTIKGGCNIVVTKDTVCHGKLI